MITDSNINNTDIITDFLISDIEDKYTYVFTTTEKSFVYETEDEISINLTEDEDLGFKDKLLNLSDYFNKLVVMQNLLSGSKYFVKLEYKYHTNNISHQYELNLKHNFLEIDYNQPLRFEDPINQPFLNNEIELNDPIQQAIDSGLKYFWWNINSRVFLYYNPSLLIKGDYDENSSNNFSFKLKTGGVFNAELPDNAVIVADDSSVYTKQDLIDSGGIKEVDLGNKVIYMD